MWTLDPKTLSYKVKVETQADHESGRIIQTIGDIERRVLDTAESQIKARPAPARLGPEPRGSSGAGVRMHDRGAQPPRRVGQSLCGGGALGRLRLGPVAWGAGATT